jgi:hypothetical protein
MQFTMPKKLCGTLLLSSLMSCAHATTETAPRTIHDFCLIGAPLTYSQPHGTDTETAANSYDTPETIKQIIDFDLKYEVTCPKEKPQ